MNPRDYCVRCLKAQKACLCHLMRPFQSGPIFVILMHPRERKSRSGTGTGRITHLCVANSHLIVGLHFAEDPRVLQFLSDDNLLPLVLYPGINAINLTQGADLLRPLDPTCKRTPVVFVIDGSWSCAKALLNANPMLRALPNICFTPHTESAYGFKTQPHKGCLSTLEAVHSLISLFNAAIFCPTLPSTAHDTLLDVFSAMVDTQWGFSKNKV